MRFGIYIHFPWCRNRCPYCDFAIAVAPRGQEPPHQSYLEAVLAEFIHQRGLFETKELVSIYFGGGTPSLWEPSCLATLVETVCGHFGVSAADLEISIECNPGDCEGSRFRAWRRAGINRVLVGVQATSNTDLATLGRDHRMGDGASGLRRTLNAGFASVGADVILGVPGRGSSLESLLEVANAGAPHISAYELTIEDRTVFGRQVAKGMLIPESEEVLAEVYGRCHETLCDKGYEHYEVSSYALPGHRSIHNSLYWEGADYLGLGNGAASLLCHQDGSARRWQNRRSPKRYLEASAGEHIESFDLIDHDEFSSEKLWLAMRTSDGAPECDFGGLQSLVGDLVEAGLLHCFAGRIAPTAKGFLYNNQLISRLALALR